MGKKKGKEKKPVQFGGNKKLGLYDSRAQKPYKVKRGKGAVMGGPMNSVDTLGTV